MTSKQSKEKQRKSINTTTAKNRNPMYSIFFVVHRNFNVCPFYLWMYGACDCSTNSYGDHRHTVPLTRNKWHLFLSFVQNGARLHWVRVYERRDYVRWAQGVTIKFVAKHSSARSSFSSSCVQNHPNTHP